MWSVDCLDRFGALLARTFSQLLFFFFLFFCRDAARAAQVRFALWEGERIGVVWGFSGRRAACVLLFFFDAESLFSAPILSSFSLTLFLFLHRWFVGRETRLPPLIAASLNKNGLESIALRLNLHLRFAAASAAT